MTGLLTVCICSFSGPRPWKLTALQTVNITKLKALKEKKG